jgi:hypothetical protein
MNKWREHILIMMNRRAAFDLSGINLCHPIDTVFDEKIVNKRKIFYRYQLDILRKTAEPMQLGRDLDDHGPMAWFHCDDFSMLTWRSDDNFVREHYPHQIVQALRLTKNSNKRNYMFIPTL